MLNKTPLRSIACLNFSPIHILYLPYGISSIIASISASIANPLSFLSSIIPLEYTISPISMGAESPGYCGVGALPLFINPFHLHPKNIYLWNVAICLRSKDASWLKQQAHTLSQFTRITLYRNIWLIFGSKILSVSVSSELIILIKLLCTNINIYSAKM